MSNNTPIHKEAYDCLLDAEILSKKELDSLLSGLSGKNGKTLFPSLEVRPLKDKAFQAEYNKATTLRARLCSIWTSVPEKEREIKFDIVNLTFVQNNFDGKGTIMLSRDKYPRSETPRAQYTREIKAAHTFG